MPPCRRARPLSHADLIIARRLADVALRLGYTPVPVAHWLVTSGAVASPVVAVRLARQMAHEIADERRQQTVAQVGADVVAGIDAAMARSLMAESPVGTTLARHRGRPLRS